MNKLQKQKVVGDLRDVMFSYASVIVTKNFGISVAAVNALRRDLRKSEGYHCVVKNKLAKIAIDATEHDHLSHLFVGPTALTYSNNPVVIAKVLVDFCAKNEKMQIVGGAMGGIFLTPDHVKSLASLPSLDESRAKLVGLLNAPASKLISVLQAPMRNVVSVLSAYAKK